MNHLENMKKIIRNFLFLSLLFSGLLFSCTDVPEPEPEPEEQQAPAITVSINEFIEAVMNDVYFWYATVPDIDIRYEFDSKKYFEKLKNEEDRFSSITEDIKKLEDSLEGKETSFGWSLSFWLVSDDGTIYAPVEFVYPNTPAEKAGIKRGDFIIKMNGMDITENNYMDLLNAASLSITYGQVGTSGITNEKTKNLTAMELDLDPVQFTKIIEHGGYKIGYLFYAQYVDNFNASIDAALQNFTNNQVTDVILDLRYNPGGYGHIAQHLCSSLAPVEVVNDEKVLVKYEWNDEYQKIWEDRGETDQLGINFNKSVPVKMGLSKIHIITGSGTASASELTITGLKPYMDVTTVGETTYGKYTGSITMKPEYYYQQESDYKDFENWGITPIVIKYTNSQGVTDFKDGFVADIPVEDDIFSPIPLGDKNELMLGTAIEDITGVEIIAMKSAKIKRDFKVFDRGFSKYDANKRELLIRGVGEELFK